MNLLLRLVRDWGQSSSTFAATVVVGLLSGNFGTAVLSLYIKKQTHTHAHTPAHAHAHLHIQCTPRVNWNKLRTSRRGVETLIAVLVLGLKVNRWATRAVPNAVADQTCQIPWGWELQTMSSPEKEWCPDTLFPACTIHTAAKSAQEKSDIPIP